MSEADLKTSITDDMKTAMRARDKARLGVIRLILADIKRVEVDERIEVDDARVIAILDKMAKQRRDSISQFEQAGRNDLVEQETFELEVITHYMPEQLAADDVARIVEEVVTETGAGSMKDMGRVMGQLQTRLKGVADMAEVSKLVRQRLGKQ